MFLGTFLGSFLGVFLGVFFVSVLKVSKENDDEESVREAPENISSISDPLSLYNKYQDKNSKLYKSIKPKVVNRVEIGADEDSE